MRVTGSVERLVEVAIGLCDADLDRTYVWHEYADDGLRFALLTAHHHLRDTAAQVAAARRAAGHPFTEAQGILAQVHEAYRDLTGVLAGTSERELDAAPPLGQWPLRAVLDHLLGAEAGFLAAIMVALDAVRAGRPSVASEPDWAKARRPPEDPAGSRADALAALARSHDAILDRLGSVTDTELDTPSFFWEGPGYPTRFRMHRFEEHMRQHTIQVDKTLLALGHPPTEAERLVRNLHTALAGVESVASGATAGGAPAGGAPLDACAASIDAITAEVRRIVVG